MVTLIVYPSEDNLLSVRRTHIVDPLKYSDEFLHDGGSLRTPAFAYILLRILLRSLEEEVALVIEVSDEVCATLDHTDGTRDVFVAVTLDAFLLEDRFQ